jgi:hypothetical protein
MEAKLLDLHWKVETIGEEENTLYSVNIEDVGRITVLDRMTGFGFRDIESGYKDKDGKFWLASGHFDVRAIHDLTVAQAIELIKRNANTCNGE